MIELGIEGDDPEELDEDGENEEVRRRKGPDHFAETSCLFVCTVNFDCGDEAWVENVGAEGRAGTEVQWDEPCDAVNVLDVREISAFAGLEREGEE